MARAPRVVEPGGSYHVISRGNNREPICRDEDDLRIFVRYLETVAGRYGWIVLAYCLMTNHYHLIVKLPFDGLSRGMQSLNGRFARRMNARHGRVGHLFQSRFYAAQIERDAHLLEACRYVVLNPVRAGMCRRPEDWHWSSHRSCAGLDLAPRFLAVDELLGLFGRRPERARHQYRAFVRDGLLRGQGQA